MFRKTSLTNVVVTLAASLGFSQAHHFGRTRYPSGWARVGQGRYQPHQGEREIARRLRQAERDDARRRARASMVTAIPADRAPARVSRRWRWIA